MKVYKGILLIFVFVCALSISSGVVVAGEYVAKQGDTWAKVAKTTGNTVNELAKMNKLKDIKDADAVPAGKKIIFLCKKEIENALKYCNKHHKDLEHGTGDYSKNFSAMNNLRANRIEYAADDPVPYGILFTDVLEYAKLWEGGGK